MQHILSVSISFVPMQQHLRGQVFRGAAESIRPIIAAVASFVATDIPYILFSKVRTRLPLHDSFWPTALGALAAVGHGRPWQDLAQSN